jgi:signal transduction histidine kinase
MERLLTGVRDVTRIDAGAVEDANESVDLVELVRGSVESARLRSGREIELRIADAFEKATVRASGERLGQVMSNLLDNALSFSPVDGVVRVSVGDRDGWLVVGIADDGPGVPAEHRDRVFDRFFTFRPERSNGHVGLGLPIAQAIARSHGGEVALCEAAGGAHFELRLPRP